MVRTECRGGVTGYSKAADYLFSMPYPISRIIEGIAIQIPADVREGMTETVAQVWAPGRRDGCEEHDTGGALDQGKESRRTGSREADGKASRKEDTKRGKSTMTMLRTVSTT